MKSAVIIQARMSSTRLPGKSMMEIEGKPIIWHTVERAKKSKEADAVLVATSKSKEDDAIAEFCRKNGIACFRGDLNDVLERYYLAAKSVDAQIIVRVTGDSPLIDAQLIDEAVRIFKKGEHNYVSNSYEPWMDGFDVEVFSFKDLEEAWKNAAMASEREHVTPYIRNNPNFKKFKMENDSRLGKVHCSVDAKEDLEFVREIYRLLYEKGLGHDFTYKEVIELLEENPELLEINKGSIINAGYAKSLKEDKLVK